MFTTYYPTSLDDLLRIIIIRVPSDYGTAINLCNHMRNMQACLDYVGSVSMALVDHIVRLRRAFNIHIQIDVVFNVSHKAVFARFIYRLNTLNQDPINYCTPAFYAQYLLET